MASFFPLLRLLLLCLSLHYTQSIAATCTLPYKWKGGWFQNGAQEVISITRTEFGKKGICMSSKDNQKFLFKSGSCYRCLAISEKHANVLMYKETYCSDETDLETLCDKINGDALLYSMFRRDAPSTPCPFVGPQTFSYNVGSGHCSSPASTIDSCTRDSRLLLKYQACPDMKGTESKVVKLECIANWKEGTTKYFLGRIESDYNALTDEDRYRCFAWEHTDKRVGFNYMMAQSEDATCNGLHTATDGAVNMRIKKVGSNNYSGCKFPSWVTSHRHWHALERGATYVVSKSNNTIRLTHSQTNSRAVISNGVGANGIRNNAHFNMGSSHHHQNKDHGGRNRYNSHQYGHYQEKREDPGLSSEARIVCSKEEEKRHNLVKVVTHYTEGCTIGYKCVVFYRRGDHIIEMQQGESTVIAGEACNAVNFDPDELPYTTLISTLASPQPCPMVGVWEEPPGNDRTQCKGRSMTHLRAGCGGDDHSMEFTQSCDPKATHKEYICHGHWKEGRSVFVVASHRDRPHHRLCLTATSNSLLHEPSYDYVSSGLRDSSYEHDDHHLYKDEIYGVNNHYNGHDQNHVNRSNRALLNRLSSNSTLLVTGHDHSCPRRLVPPTTTLSVNLTIKAECLVSLSSSRCHWDSYGGLWVLLGSLICAALFQDNTVHRLR